MCFFWCAEKWNGAMGEVNSVGKQKVELVTLLAVTVGGKAAFVHGTQFGYTDPVVAWRELLIVWVIGSRDRWILRTLCL